MIAKFAELKHIDDLLRGRKTRPELLEKGTDHIDAKRVLTAGLILGAVYGAFMGLFAVFQYGAPGFEQLAASMLKVPLVFVLTLAVTFPSLYVFSAMMGGRCSPAALFKILAAAIAVNCAILASLGPITGFFTLSTTSYPFMRILNFIFFGIAGGVSLEFLRRSLQSLESVPVEGAPAAPKRLNHFFDLWMTLVVFVTFQMCWVLRPLIGDPLQPITWFSSREADAFTDFFDTLGRLFGTG